MTKFALLSAAALVCVAAATPAKAQEVIYNPCYCAQFYPYANCQNKGPNNPTPATISAVWKCVMPLSSAPAPAPWARNSTSVAADAVSLAT